MRLAIWLPALLAIAMAYTNVPARAEPVDVPADGSWVEVTGVLEDGDEKLDDGSRADLWTLRPRGAGVLTLILRSDAFDPYMLAREAAASEDVLAAFSDDGPAGSASWIEARLDGLASIAVSASAARCEGRGAYTLLIRVDPDDTRRLPDLETLATMTRDAAIAERARDWLLSGWRGSAEAAQRRAREWAELHEWLRSPSPTQGGERRIALGELDAADQVEDVQGARDAAVRVEAAWQRIDPAGWRAGYASRLVEDLAVLPLLPAEHRTTLRAVDEGMNRVSRGEHVGLGADPSDYSRQWIDVSSVLGEQHWWSLECLRSFVQSLLLWGRYADAESVGSDGFERSAAILGRDHPTSLAWLQVDLDLLMAGGRYADAEVRAWEAVVSAQSALGRSHPYTLSARNSLAGILTLTGRDGDAATLLREVFDTRRRLLGPNHPSTLVSLLNLGAVLQCTARFLEAEPLQREAVQRLEATLGAHHVVTLAAQQSLAVTLEALGRVVEAEQLHRDAALRFATTLGENHPAVLPSLLSKAHFLAGQGQAGEAEPMYRAAVDTSTRLLGGEHRGTLSGLSGLATLLDATDRPAEAEPLFTQALDLAERLRLDTAGDINARAARERELSLGTLTRRLASTRSRLGLHAGAIEALEAGRARALLDLLALGGRGAPEVVAATAEPALAAEIRAAAEEEATRYAPMAAAEAAALRVSDADERERMLANVRALRTQHGDASARLSALMGRAVPWMARQNAEALQQRLRPGEVAVLFGWDERGATIAALHAGGAVSVTIDEARATSLETSLRELATSFSLGNPVPPGRVDELARAIFPPEIESVIRTAQRVVVMPDGPLIEVPVDVLAAQIQQGAEVIQSPTLRLYLDQRDRVRERARARAERNDTSLSPALLLGRPIYDAERMLAASQLPLPPAPEAAAIASRESAFTLEQLRLFGGRLTDLEGTEQEIDAIALAFQSAAHEPDRQVTRLIGAEATLANLERTIAEVSPRTLHLATHGLIGSRERPTEAALALTAPLAPSEADPGFLTLERLLRGWGNKLSECDLVILSACDTGRGVRTGENELALPWGFFHAGATAVVASLWQVSDASTALLMARFQENRLGSFTTPRSIRGRDYQPGDRVRTIDALDEAKAWVRSLTRDDAREALTRAGVRGSIIDAAVLEAANAPDRPYEHWRYWAAFVLVGSPE